MQSDKEALKREVAARAAAEVQQGMAVGLGTGSTAAYMIAALIGRVQAEGLRFVGVPTSRASAAQAEAGGIVLTDLAAHPVLDLAIDGADQVESGTLNLVKGLGGALLREKIVAASSRRLVIMADDSKLVARLAMPVPVEVAAFGWQATRRHIEALGATARLRLAKDGGPFVTDGGGHILDCDFGPGHDAAQADQALHGVVGVIETGYFIRRADQVLIAAADGVRRLTRA